MPIVYDKMIKMFEERKITAYTMRVNNVIGQATYRKIIEGGHIDTRSLSKLCSFLNCQPGDILEYVPDDEEE